MRTWQLDPAHSNVEFAVRHLMISTVKGRFGQVSGTLTTDDTNDDVLPSSFALDVSVDVASIDTRQEQRDAHLRSADFFDAEHFPKLTFKGRRIEGDPKGEFRLIGELTIRGVTHPITLDVTAEGENRDPWGNDRKGFSATGKIRRSDFGLTWNQALESGGVVVGDDIKISVDAEFVSPVPAAVAA